MVRNYGDHRSFGNTLNANDMKAMKGKAYEYLIQNSLPMLEHVDQPGYDLRCRETGVKIEVKSKHDLLLTGKKSKKKYYILSFKKFQWFKSNEFK